MWLVLLLAQLDAGAGSLVVRFPCDDKYAEPGTCDEAAWREQVLKDPTVGANLLEHRSGGPEGAVWNSGKTPLYVFVVGRPQVRLGKALLKLTTAGSWSWVRVPFATWRAALRGSENDPYRSFELSLDGRVAGSFRFAEGE